MEENSILRNIVPDCARDTINYPCGCEFVDLMQLIQNIINASVYLATFLLVLLFAYVGFLYVTNPTNPANRTQAKNVAISGVVGFVVVLGAFLIVSTVMNTFANKDQYGKWESFFGIARSHPEQCANPDLTINTGGGGGTVVAPPGTGGSGGGTGSLSCSNCTSVRSASFNHKPPGTGGVGGFGCDLTKSREEIDYCQLNTSLFQKLEQVQRTFGGAWRVNEMWPPTVRHSNPCHNAGTCVDAAPTSSQEPAVLAAFINAARNAGLYPVWEDRALQTLAQCAELRIQIEAAGGEGVAIQYGLPVSPHFSLYNNSGSRTGCFR